MTVIWQTNETGDTPLPGQTDGIADDRGMNFFTSSVDFVHIQVI